MQLVALAVTLGILAILTLFFFQRQSTTDDSRPSNAYILWNQVNHARLLPAESSHSFTYSTVALFVSLDSLENHSLDLGYGRIFGYGGIKSCLVGLRATPYLTQSSGSIREKLVSLLIERGILKDTEQTFQDAWMLTMPSYLGFEGINPLTVYFCYKTKGELWLVVLEVHNTFGESHVYILQVGVDEDSISSPSFDHRWTFPRAFHVSPFNDRAGYYTVSVRKPSHPPNDPSASSKLPLPVVSVHLHTPSSDSSGPGPLKLTALFRATHALPLDTPNLLKTLLNYPFSLLLSLPRIFHHAWILHYKKRLDVYIRPEPFPASSEDIPSVGVRWQSISFLEAYCRRLVHDFLERRARERGISVSLASGDPSTPKTVFGDQSSGGTLTIRYLTPRFYTILFSAPSASLAYLLGAKSEGIFEVSDEALFLKIFEGRQTQGMAISLDQRLRGLPLPARLKSPDSIPPQHFLGSSRTSGFALVALLFLGTLERWIFGLVKARVVSGDAPWEEWKRAEKVFIGKKAAIEQRAVGSTTRGGNVGSVRTS